MDKEEEFGMDYDFMKFPVERVGHDGRSRELVDYMLGKMEEEKELNIYSPIVEGMHEEASYLASELLPEIQYMIEHIYFLDSDLNYGKQEAIYEDWLFDKIQFEAEDMNFKEFIRECDGFLSHLRVYEVLEDLVVLADEDEEIRLYVEEDIDFIELREAYDRIVESLASGDDIMGGWEDIEAENDLEERLAGLADSLADFEAYEDLYKEVSELKKSIVPII